jgi:hypothetical protein
MSKQKTHRENQERTYDSDMAGLMSLRLIAAPDPKDDLSDDELTAFCEDPQQSPELIQHLIDFIKTI